MQLVVDAGPRPIEFAPSTLAAEVAQNVRMIITTPRGSLPLDREFGLDFSVIDQPLPRAKALLARDIVSQVARYEPRARVDQVDWQETVDEAMDGQIIPLVTINVVEV